MKKTLTYILAVALAAVSCHRIDPEGGHLAIGFATLETKAGATADNISASGSAFVVRGSESAGATWNSSSAAAVFDGVTVTSNGTEWTYSPLRYWIPESAYHFRAVWPAGAFSGTGAATYADALSEAGASITGFTVAQNPADQKDLLLSNLAGVTTDAVGTPSSDPVQLQFSHILSNVQFVVKVDDDGEDTYLQGISISSIKPSGSYTYSGSAYAWTPTGSAVAFTQDLTSSAILTEEFPTAAQCEMFMIPQTIADGVTIELTYKLGSAAATTQTLHTAANTEWLPGKKYIYQISIASAEIEFTAKVIDWIDGTTVTLTK